MRARGGSEDGAVVVVAALLMTALLLFAALVVDLGGLYVVRQAVVGDVDAAARAAATALGNAVQDGEPCSNEPTSPAHQAAAAAAQGIADGNGGQSTLEVTVDCTGDRYVVEVVGERAATGIFTGGADRDVTATSTARYVSGVDGMYLPIALCRNGFVVREWIEGSAEDPSNHIRASRAHDDGDCRDAVTNFGWLQPPGGQSLQSALQFGLSSPGGSGDPYGCIAASAQGGSLVGSKCQGGPELFDTDIEALFETLNTHRCPDDQDPESCPVRTLVVHDEQVGTGEDATLTRVGFLDVVITRADPGDDGDDPALHLYFRDFRTTIETSAVGPGRSYLCSVDVGPEIVDSCQDE